MIIADNDKCITCKECEKICHSSSIKVENNKISINTTLCSTCTQCIAICPTHALSWNNTKPKKIHHNILPQEDEMEEFLKQRRSVRKFKSKKVEEDILEKIALISKYAPTNNYNIDAIIVNDSNLIDSLELECISFIQKLYNIFYKPKLIFTLLERLTPAMNKIDKTKTERTLRRGTIFQNAPALIILIADSSISHTELSCQYALYNMILYADTLGIGSCISGAGKTILSRNKKTRNLLNLPKNINI